MSSELYALDSNSGEGEDARHLAVKDSAQQLGVEAGDLVRRLFCLFLSSQPVKPSRLLSAPEVAELLNTNTQVVYRLARNQNLPAVNLGERMLRFTELSVAEFINRGGISRAA